MHTRQGASPPPSGPHWNSTSYASANLSRILSYLEEIHNRIDNLQQHDDPNGDILYRNPEDEAKVKAIVRQIQKRYNS